MFHQIVQIVLGHAIHVVLMHSDSLLEVSLGKSVRVTNRTYPSPETRAAPPTTTALQASYILRLNCRIRLTKMAQHRLGLFQRGVGEVKNELHRARNIASVFIAGTARLRYRNAFPKIGLVNTKLCPLCESTFSARKKKLRCSIGFWFGRHGYAPDQGEL